MHDQSDSSGKCVANAREIGFLLCRGKEAYKQMID